MFQIESLAKAAKPFDILRVENLIIDTEPAAYSFEPTIIIFEKSGWSKSRIFEELKKSSNIFSQCDTRIRSVNILYVQPPKEGAVFSLNPNLTLEKTYSMSQIARNFSDHRPTIFLVNRADTAAGIGFNEDFVRSLSTTNSSLGPELDGTAWISLPLSEKFMKKYAKHFGPLRPAAYSTVAHEVGHVLGLRHENIREGNIMSSFLDVSKSGGKLARDEYNENLHVSQPNQCAVIQRSKWINKKQDKTTNEDLSIQQAIGRAQM